MRNILKKIPGYNEAVEALKKGKFPMLLSGLAGSAGSLAAASLFSNGGFKGALLVIVPGYDQVISWAADMELLMPDRQVVVFNPAEALPFEVVAASREPAAGRLQALASLRGHGEKTVVIASVEALLPKLIPPEYWERAALFLRLHQEIDHDNLAQRLVLAGYERLETVSGPGQFAIRGDVVDIYPFYELPVRLEFWGDEITSLRRLNPETQRSQKSLDEIEIWPAREFVYHPDLAAPAVERIQDAYKKRKSALKGSRNALARLQRRVNRLLRWPGKDGRIS